MPTIKRKEVEPDQHLCNMLASEMKSAIQDNQVDFPQEIHADMVIRELCRISSTQLIDLSEALGHHRNWATNTGDYYQDITVTSLVKVLRAFGLNLAIVSDIDPRGRYANPLYVLQESQVMPEEVKIARELRKKQYKEKQALKKKQKEEQERLKNVSNN